jgi:protease-4
MLAGDDAAEGAPTDAFAALAPAPTDLLARVIAEVSAILAGPSIQVRCLECPSVAAKRSGPQAMSWWRLLSGA